MEQCDFFSQPMKMRHAEGFGLLHFDVYRSVMTLKCQPYILSLHRRVTFYKPVIDTILLIINQRKREKIRVKEKVRVVERGTGRESKIEEEREKTR